MSITVNTNVSAMMAQNQLHKATQSLNQSLERLASGSRINSAKDDAAGLQISNRLEAQISGLGVAQRNANDGISIMQTAEGAMNETSQLLQRMRDLSLQSSNGANSPDDRRALQEEFTALNDELNRIAETTSFGGRKLLNGQFGSSSFQIGSGAGEALQIELKSMRTDQLQMGGVAYQATKGAPDMWRVDPNQQTFSFSYQDSIGRDITQTIEAKPGDDIEQVATYINGQTQVLSASVNEHGQLQLFADSDRVTSEVTFSGALAEELNVETRGRLTVDDLSIGSVGGAQMSISVIDKAIKFVDSHRAELGANQNRLGHTINNLANMEENLSVSQGRIRDTDYAKETTQMIKQQILQQVSTTILAQAKQSPSLAMTLLQS
ncbi:flagellin [Vibrio sp. 10N.286.49.C2]|uniref:flagellin n=1 Tax=unclassified Vibrio TaxID=2614977 RepID=UPI000C853BA8|nr:MULTISPECIES: flagellin [unclassified Vibrio]PMH36815.1 flagellin [Vibrio sp. 10N.286.49.C2]PMH46978.1 flagellin [Vibrio sp. 10N.286.49.B1]PMH82624.1 flagellin [Vibrio sp. 10N.286.48.B7]